VNGADAIFCGHYRSIHMGIDVAEHHHFSIVTAQVALASIGGDIARLWCTYNGD
jgi:hypothetical protein